MKLSHILKIIGLSYILLCYHFILHKDRLREQFFGVMFFYLIQSNSMMFKNILNMFLDFTQEGVYSFKNHIDNFILIKKISEFNLLLVDFSLGILDKYNKKISTRSVISGNMNMSMDEGQGFGAIKTDKKDDMDNAKKEEKKKINL